MLNQEEYSHFTESDFISDPYFQDWVLRPGDNNKIFWQSFFQIYPEKIESAETARKFLKSVSFKEEFPDESVIQRSLFTHLQTIGEIEKSKVIDIRSRKRLYTLLKIAAVFGGIILLAALWLSKDKEDKQFITRTEFGNIKSVLLPDSSVVVLNGNSEIKFSPSFEKERTREIWLKGEAFFNVNHLNNDTAKVLPGERFIVHTDDVVVEVLGTAFNIRERRGKTEVVLQRGKIKVRFVNGSSGDIILSPGEMITHTKDDKIQKATTVAEDYVAWKEKKLILNDPGVGEIVEYLEDVYGKRIVIENRDLVKRKIDGPILITNLDDALFILSTVLNVDIKKKEDTIYIRTR